MFARGIIFSYGVIWGKGLPFTKSKNNCCKTPELKIFHGHSFMAHDGLDMRRGFPAQIGVASTNTLGPLGDNDREIKETCAEQWY